MDPNGAPQVIQNPQVLDVQELDSNNIDIVIQNLVNERNALRTQNMSLWNLVDKQRATIQQLQNQVMLLRQALKKKGKNGVIDEKDVINNGVKSSQRSQNYNVPQQRQSANAALLQQHVNGPMGAVLNEKYVRKISAPNIKDHEIIHDLKGRVRSNSENAINIEDVNQNYEMGSENDDYDSEDSEDERPERLDSNLQSINNYIPDKPSPTKSKSSKSVSTVVIPLQVDLVRVEVIDYAVKNEKGKESLSFIIHVSRLTNSGTEENSKIEKSYNDFVQLDAIVNICINKKYKRYNDIIQLIYKY